MNRFTITKESGQLLIAKKQLFIIYNGIIVAIAQLVLGSIFLYFFFQGNKESLFRFPVVASFIILLVIVLSVNFLPRSKKLKIVKKKDGLLVNDKYVIKTEEIKGMIEKVYVSADYSPGTYSIKLKITDDSLLLIKGLSEKESKFLVREIAGFIGMPEMPVEAKFW